MRRQDITELLESKPFVAFRLILSNGIRYEIRHPETAMVTAGSLRLEVDEENATQVTVVSIQHIIQLEYTLPKI